MVVGTLRCDLRLGEVRSLKTKRAVLRPLLAGLRRFDVSAAETGGHDAYRDAEVSVAVVGPDHAHVGEVLDRCERFVAANPEFDLLGTRRRVLDDDDLD